MDFRAAGEILRLDREHVFLSEHENPNSRKDTFRTSDQSPYRQRAQVQKEAESSQIRDVTRCQKNNHCLD